MCNTACQSLKTNANVKVECIRGKEREPHTCECSLVILFIGKLWLDSGRGWQQWRLISHKKAIENSQFIGKTLQYVFSFFQSARLPLAHTHISWNAPPSINYQQMRRKKNTTREHNNWRMKFNIVLVSYLICLVSKLRAEKRAELEFQFI